MSPRKPHVPGGCPWRTHLKRSAGWLLSLQLTLRAYAWAGLTYALRAQNRWMVDVVQESADAIRLARRAIELGQLNDLVLCVGGSVLAFIGGELDLGAECISRGLSMNANLAVGWEFSGLVHIGLGEHQTALLEHLRRAERLSPRGPSMTQMKLGMAAAHFYSGQYEEGARLAERITRAHPTFAPAWRIMAVSNALSGDQTLAAEATKQALQLDPSQRISSLTWLPLRRAEDRERWKEGLLPGRLFAIAAVTVARMNPVYPLVPCGEHAAL
jgi:tetratricopeptide (TPR) repeat protein